MSISQKQEVKCPVCAELCEIEVWQSIQAADADIKDDLLKGRVNILKCASCGASALVSVPVLYTDSEKKLMISFFPSSDESAKLKNFAHLLDEAKKSGEYASFEDYNLRYVSDYNSFLEKILIFDNGFHDKVIEVLKLLVLMQESDKMDKRVAMFGKCTADAIEFMVTVRAEGKVYTSRVPMTTYEQVSRSLKESGVKYKSFDWELVDIEYAKNLLYGANNILR